MSSKIITDLTSYTAAELSASNGVDLFFVTDLEHQETKKITGAELAAFAIQQPGITYNNGAITAVEFSSSKNPVGFYGTSSWSRNTISASYALTASYAENQSTVTATSVGALSYGVVENGIGPNLTFRGIKGTGSVTVTRESSTNNLVIDVPNILSAAGPLNAVQFNYPNGVFNGDANFVYNPVNGPASASVIVNGIVSAGHFSSSLVPVGYYGTASWARNANSSSYSLSGSYALTASYAQNLTVDGIVPVFAKSLLPLGSYSNHTSSMSFSLPVGYSKWGEFSMDVVAWGDSHLGSGTSTGIFRYSDYSSFPTSSSEGEHNEGEGYSVNNSDDSSVYVWKAVGVIKPAFQTANPLVLRFILAGQQVNRVTVVAKVYAKL